MSPLARQIGKRIALLRKTRGISGQTLALKSGISKGYLSDLENGKRLPSLEMLARIAKSLGTRLREFF